MYSFLFRIKKIDFIEYRQGGGIGGLCILTAPRGARPFLHHYAFFLYLVATSSIPLSCANDISMCAI